MEQLIQQCSRYIFPSDPATGTLGSINLNLGLLQLFGVPLFGARDESNTLLVVYGVLSLIFIRLPYHSFQIYDLVLCWRNFDDVMQNVCISLLHLGGGIKTIIVFSRLDDVYRIVRQFRFMTSKYVRSEKQRAVFSALELENKVSLVLYSSMIGFSCVSGMIMLFVDPINIAGKIFPYRAKLPDVVPFDAQTVYIPVSILIIGIQIVGMDYLNVTFINLTRCQLRMLNISFDELNEGKVYLVASDPRKHLYSLVEHHTYILSVRDQIESVFRYPMLLQFTASLMTCAITGLQALVRSDTSGLVMIYFYVGCVLAQLLIHCWFGNEVSEQNKTLALSGYATTWYNFDNEFKKTLILFLMNAQRPLYFTAGGYVKLSLQTFSGILSKSYTFLAVLRQQYTDK